MGSDGRISATQLLERLDEDVSQLERMAQQTLPEEFRHRRQKLEKLQRTLSEPPKTETDVQQIQQEVRMLQREIQRLNDSINEAQGKRGDDGMAVFRQQGALVAKKLEKKEAQVEKAEDARDRLKSKVEDLESRLRQMPGGRMMRGEEFKNYANIQKKMTTCGKHMVKYDNCVDNDNKFDECYHLYYQKFLQCCKEIDIKDKNRKKIGKK
mgnify:CR=1 FL=1